ncbi:MAG: hypothetical protein DYG98_27195 [Haliscomenobacteraceae bacterium CHB4]|nr:hypothetical protein [Haliscomenobacteraceae bacterium CHB4]
MHGNMVKACDYPAFAPETPPNSVLAADSDGETGGLPAFALKHRRTLCLRQIQMVKRVDYPPSP